ncbi:MAG: carnitine 3-dehydrogenase [Gammaproteobacteria bacterium]|nr:carnitine 3-dehydrogenase [Gammaproteobacteria bacterium]MYH89339.1 carnitine 3-dehydrogenase [Gammaproteobacteria bacterium]
MSEAQKAAIIGGGVIGGGWTARFLLNGWDVAVYDPDPDAERKIGEVLANARRSLPSLYDFALPDEGRLDLVTNINDAVGGARWIQESVPERLDVKRAVYRDIQAHAPADAVLASSTSGFKPSELGEGAARPEQILVVHPFNPVYLLPLVEVVPSPCTDGAIRDRAVELMRGVGMYPLLIRKEIDGHVNDRLQEALWREALWLVSDGIATTREIDDSIRFGCGLRWAQMGSFQTFWLAGGEGGMRHFMAQFGPALKWPWTKLMDVPELTDTLIDTIADQCDQQSGGMTPREMERVRDNNLVGMMRALKRTDWGAGASLNEHDRSLVPEGPAAPEPVEMFRRQVPQSWLDYNGHMNEAHYLEVFSQANDRIMALVGADQAYIDRGLSFFTVETHIRHLDELHAGEGIRVTTQVLQGSGKRLRVFHRLETEDGRLAATGEHLLIHVNLSLRKSCEPDEPVRSKLAAYEEAHRNLALPEGAGRSIG